MLLGEHAVLHGRRALVCAIDQRITVELFQTLEKTVRIFSDLGTYESPIDQIEDHPDFRFVLDAVKQYAPEQGIELKITSDFSSDIGFGSSAAVTVATHAALMNFPRSRTSATDDCRAGAKTPPLNKMDLFQRSLATIHRVQGRGSGADIAASVFGGVVAYRADPLEIYIVEQASRLLSAAGRSAAGGKRAGRSFCSDFPLTAVYSGSKMKTADVIKIVEIQRKSDPEKYDRIFDEMDASAGEVISDFSTLGKKLIENQFLMEEMGLCNAALSEIISIFQALEIPAKISGSGLGDCAIGLGKVPTIGSFATYALNVTTQGVAIAD
jgi:mevalonate kinase